MVETLASVLLLLLAVADRMDIVCLWSLADAALDNFIADDEVFSLLVLLLYQPLSCEVYYIVAASCSW